MYIYICDTYIILTMTIIIIVSCLMCYFVVTCVASAYGLCLVSRAISRPCTVLRVFFSPHCSRPCTVLMFAPLSRPCTVLRISFLCRVLRDLVLLPAEDLHAVAVRVPPDLASVHYAFGLDCISGLHFWSAVTIYIYIYIYIYTYIHTYTCVYIYIYIYVYIHTSLQKCTSKGIPVSVKKHSSGK